MYMKMIESRNAQMKFDEGALQLAPAAGNRGRIGGRQIHGCGGFAQRVDPIGHRESGRHVSSQLPPSAAGRVDQFETD
jgi:hypothetical protein